MISNTASGQTMESMESFGQEFIIRIYFICYGTKKENSLKRIIIIIIETVHSKLLQLSLEKEIDLYKQCNQHSSIKEKIRRNCVQVTLFVVRGGGKARRAR